MKTNLWRRLLLAVTLAALAGSPAFAQTFDGTLRGTVQDPTGAVIGGAKVTARNDATGLSTSVETTSAGTYNIPNLLVGTYTIGIESAGFGTYERRQVRVQAGRIAEVNASLVPGPQETVVEVRAGSELVSTTSAAISNTFERVHDIPVGGLGAPNVLNLAILIPNVTVVSGTTSSSISVGGNRTRFINYTIDGADNNTSSTTAANQNVIPDAVQELTLSTNVFSAEYGRSAGANFNVITRTGTNQWRGGGWWYNQNRNYNAMTNIDKASRDASGELLTQPPRFDQQRVGGRVGGPVFRDRLFVFGAYEWFNQGTTAQSPVATSFTSAGRDQLRALAANNSVRQVLDLFPLAGSATATRQVVVNGTTHDIPVGTVTGSAPNFSVSHDYIINADVNLDQHQFRTRYLETRFQQPNFGPFPDPVFQGSSRFNVNTGIVNHVYTISPYWVNDLKISYQRTLTDFGVGEGLGSFPNITLNDLGIAMGPNQNFPQNSLNNLLTFSEAMSYSAGKWNLKWGVQFRRHIGFNVFAQRMRGDYIYVDMTEFINDRAPTGLRGRTIGPEGAVGRFDMNHSGVHNFFQADWRMTPRLTFNLGARYEWNGTPAGVHLNAENAIATLPGTPLVFRVPASDKNNFSPRVGFAWDPTGSGKWAVRGGSMLAYDVQPANFELNLQPSQRGIFFFEGGAPILGAGSCSGVAFPAQPWCTAPFEGFLASGAIPNVTPNITTQADARALTANLMLDQVMPKVIQTSVGVQRALWNTASFEARYQFTRGLLLPVQLQLNSRTAFRNGAQPLPVFFNPSEVPAMVDLSAPTLADFLAARGRPLAAEGFGAGITNFPAIGSSKYHAVSFDFSQRFFRGITTRTNYTWSRNFDNSTADLNTSGISQRRPNDMEDMGPEWGRSALDVTHKFSLAYTYELPSPRLEGAFARGFLHGWELSGIVQANTGQPATAYSGLDSNGNLDAAVSRALFNPNGTTTIGAGGDRRLNAVCRDPGTGATSVASSAAGCGANANVVGYVARDPSQMFMVAEAGVLSNIGRNTLSTPGLHIWNMALAKTTSLGEGRSLQIRLETFNTFNHRNFTFTRAVQAPLGVAASQYSLVGSDQFLDDKRLNGGSRIMQLGLRFNF